MPIINVHFRDGFENDSAIVRIGDQTVSREGLRTRQQIGRAAVFAIDVPPGTTEVHVKIPTRNLESMSTVQVPTQGEVYVGFSIENDTTLTSVVSDAPFHYA